MALSRHHATMSRPRNVQEIVEEAQNFEFNTDRTLQQWIRSGQMLITEASICEQDENLQMAYLYMYRHAELVLTRLPAHPQYKDPKYKDALTQAKRAVSKNIVKLEEWNPRINQDYQRYSIAMEKRNSERRRIQDQYDDVQRQRQVVDAPEQFTAERLDTSQSRQHVVGMALKEMKRRDASRQHTVQTSQRSPPPSYRDSMGQSETQLSDDIREAARHLHHPVQQGPHTSASPSFGNALPSYAYPAVPAKEGAMDWRTPPTWQQQQQQPVSAHNRDLPPAIPSKRPLYDTLVPELPASAPPIPSKQLPSPPPLPSKITSEAVQLADDAAAATAALATTELPSLRPLLIPPSLTTTFTQLAAANTRQNIETCGILAGTLLSNTSTLALTHLVVPAQTATANTCDTTAAGDTAVFEYCEARRLLVLGWIHTHPSQSCFLSSRDLHTSAGYQALLPEAVAVVCAPRHAPAVGIFRLTDPPGLETIVQCRREGTFHPHPDVDGGLYTDASAGEEDGQGGEPWGGHVLVAPELRLEVADLRGK